MLDRKAWNHMTVYKNKWVQTYLKMFLQIIYLIYMYEKDLVLNNLLWLICHKTQPNQAIYI